MLQKKRLFRILVRLAAGLVLLVSLFILSIYLGLWGRLPSKAQLAELEYQQASEVYTADSVLIGKFYVFDRQPISFIEMPASLVESLIAIEDRRFYEHSGIDYKSLFRVGLKTLLLGDKSAGGGSTLSQQLAKNLYPRKKSGKFYLVVNKIKEMITAGRLESVFTKEELIEHYLNTVPFGDNTFGIESASLKFFNKKTRELELEESAVLTGMLKATYSYNPRLFPERSTQRRNTVLRAMEETGSLSEEEADSLVKLPLELNYRKYDYNQGIAPYFREEVRKRMEDWIEEQREVGNEYNLYTSGLKIYTTLNYEMQVLAEAAMKEHLAALQVDFEKSYGSSAPWIKDEALLKKVVRRSEAYSKLAQTDLSENQVWDSLNIKRTMMLRNWEGEFSAEASTVDSIRHYMKFLNTGSLSIDPYSGAVNTWIGGIDFEHYKYDHISQSRRQTGSSFKPIVYTAALEQGIKPCSYFSAREVEYENLEGWSPKNSSEDDETYLNYSMEEALTNSVNTVSVKILEKTGIPEVINLAEKLGIESELPHQPSLALGTGEIRIEELAGAYAAYINHGKPATPYLISSLRDSEGELLFEHHNRSAAEAAFSDENRQIMLELMKSVVDNGTASRIRNRYKLKNDIAGKTGTTQNNKDAWFVAITPKLVHVSWVGLDQHEIGFRTTALGQGANAALPLFALWMQKLNASPGFRSVTTARFEETDPSVLELLDCKPVKKDSFFKRLFKNPEKKKSKKFKS